MMCHNHLLASYSSRSSQPCEILCVSAAYPTKRPRLGPPSPSLPLINLLLLYTLPTQQTKPKLSQKLKFHCSCCGTYIFIVYSQLYYITKENQSSYHILLVSLLHVQLLDDSMKGSRLDKSKKRVFFNRKDIMFEARLLKK